MRDSEETQTPDMIETAPPAPTATQPEPAGAAPVRRATKFMADLSQRHADRGGASHERDHGAIPGRGEGRRRGDPRQRDQRGRRTAAQSRRRRCRDPRLVEGRDRPHSRGDRGARRRPQDRRSIPRWKRTPAPSRPEPSGWPAVVAAFEAEMGAFFERLIAEEDPTRIATMAETMPDPPSLARRCRPPRSCPSRHRRRHGTRRLGRIRPRDTARPAAEIDFAAAEAEALSFDGRPQSRLGRRRGRSMGVAPPSSPVSTCVRGSRAAESHRRDARGAHLDPRRRGRPRQRGQHRDLQAQPRPDRRRLVDRRVVRSRRRVRVHSRATTAGLASAPARSSPCRRSSRRSPASRTARSRSPRTTATRSTDRRHPRGVSLARPAIVIALPPGESDPVCSRAPRGRLRGHPGRRAGRADAALASRRDIAVAILDGEVDDDEAARLRGRPP